MSQFSFSLTREDTFNHLYEYIISHSCEFFGVPNYEVAYSIVINNDNFIMLVFTDENKNIVDSLDIDTLAYTDSHYAKIQINPAQQNLINIVNGNICLNECEIRYIKFRWERILNEVGMMFYSMVNACLKLTCHEANLSYDSTKDVFFYKGYSCPQKYKNKKTNIVDLTEQMKKSWY